MFKTIQECRLDLVAHTVGLTGAAVEAGCCSCDVYKDVDDFPCSAARVSFGNEDKTGNEPEKDLKLMKYLADHQHTSPFEHQSATFLIEVPLFIRSQIMRHRTFSYNEISRRYTDENIEFWIPDKFRKQSVSNRQASSQDEEVTHFVDMGHYVKPLLEGFEQHCEFSVGQYKDMIQSGLCREQARALLPQSLLTKFYMSGTLLNWSKFIKLRKHEGAQYEVTVVANRIEDRLRILWPNATGVLLDADE